MKKNILILFSFIQMIMCNSQNSSIEYLIYTSDNTLNDFSLHAEKIVKFVHFQ